ncbi:uncharacterized protein [Nicotiana tomentosiformis]|uniref:uncharacterized protein n=1 Tax=Nicotiana tomentosiformis TaxID=4098 RepID=UPI00388CD24E
MKSHLKENCYNIIGYPAHFKSKKKGTSIIGHLAKTELQSVQPPSIPQPPIFTYNQILQMLNNMSSFLDSSAYMARSSGQVQMPTGESARITHVGESSKVKKDLNCCATFYHDFFVLQELFSARLKAIGREQDGLYMLKLGSRDTTHTHNKSMANKSSFTLDNCDVCPLARQTRIVFPTNASRATKPFQLLYLDVLGPCNNAIYDGMKYFLTLVDDFSRWTWTFMTRIKLDVSCLLKSFIVMVLNQFERKIKKGYKIYDLEKQVVFISRDVVFNEFIFPFKTIQDNVELLFPEVVDPDNLNVSLLSFIDSSTPSASSEPQAAQTFSVEVEPTTYTQAAKDPRWVEAMQLEIKVLEDNDTWKVVPLPQGKRVIGCKWVYKIKYKATGELERFKVRLVAKGYNQQEGLDYQETFSPVVEMVTVRAVISIAVVKHWTISQMDVYNTFL